MQVVQPIREAIFHYCIDKEQKRTLDGLPVEILLLISDLLSYEDINCLSLSNSRLFTVLERQRKKLRLPIGSDKVPILRRLEHDLPDYFMCHCCFVLHKFDGSQCSTVLNSPYGWPDAIRCADKLKHAIIILGFSRTNYIFYFFYIQLAMKRFYHGPHFGISTESLSYTEVQEYDDSVTLFSLEAQICPGGERLSCSPTHSGLFTCQGSLETLNPPISSEETQYSGEYLGRYTQSELPNLCLRIQDIMLLARNQPYLLSSGGTSFVPRPPSCICAHLSPGVFSLIRQMVLSYTAGDRPIDYATCDICNTDYELQLIECNEYDLALVITRWMNLGPGLSLDNPQWQDHQLWVANSVLIVDGYKKPI